MTFDLTSLEGRVGDFVTNNGDEEVALTWITSGSPSIAEIRARDMKPRRDASKKRISLVD